MWEIISLPFELLCMGVLVDVYLLGEEYFELGFKPKLEKRESQ